MSRSKSKKPWYLQLHTQVGIALGLGFLVGVCARVLGPHGFPTVAFGEGVGLVGDIFLRLLKMVIIPLIFTLPMPLAPTELRSSRSREQEWRVKV